MVVIRLARGGAKKKPFYHVVVTDSRAARNAGSYIEKIGHYNPVARGQETPLEINLERFNHWLGQGAKASERVGKLVKKAAVTVEA